MNFLNIALSIHTIAKVPETILTYPDAGRGGLASHVA